MVGLLDKLEFIVLIIVSFENKKERCCLYLGVVYLFACQICLY